MKRIALLVVVVVALAFVPAGSGATGPQCGDVLTASAVLTANLLCSGDGLTFSPSSDATLDLHGYSILGHDGTGTGLYVSPGIAKVTVKNGTIRGFGTGIQLDGFGSARLERLTVRNNGVGVAGGIGGGPATVLANSTIINNRFDGVQVAFIRPFEMISDRVAENGRYGINAFEDSLSLLKDSSIARNGSDGVNIDNSFSVISGNTFFANGGTGLSIADTLLCLPGASYVVSNNVATQNGNGGMIAVPSTYPTCDPVPGISSSGNHASGNANFQCIVIVCETP